MSGVRNEDGGALRKERGEEISAPEKTEGGEQDGKVDKTNKDVKRSEGEKKRRKGRGGGYSVGKAAAAFTCPPTPFSSLTLPPTEASLKVSRL